MTTLGPEFRHVDRVTKARKPVDGDGDGWVYDGTPKKRPATPAERAAGAALRAKKGGPAKRPAKKAPPKNDYDKRVDKFDRAINQAIRAKNPKEIKRVRELIRGDMILKKPDRDRLEQILDARRDGKPDPAPRKAAAKAPAKKVPAKKAPAKKPAPKEEKKPPQSDHGELRGEDGKPILPPMPKKKAPAKKAPQKIREAAAEAPEFDLRRRPASQRQQSPVVGGYSAAASETRSEARQGLPDQVKRLKAAAMARIKAATSDQQLDEIEMKVDRYDSDGWDVQDLRRAIADRRGQVRQEAKANIRENLRRNAPKPSPRLDAARSKKGFDLPGSMQHAGKYAERIKAAKTRAELDAILREANMDNRLRDVHRRALKVDAMNRVKDIDQKPETSFGNLPDSNTPHGKKTQAWKRLVQRDIDKAKNDRALVPLMVQINNLRRDERISQAEWRDLMDKVEAKQQDLAREVGQARHASVGQRIRDRVASAIKRPADSRAQHQKKADSLMRAIEAADTVPDLSAIQRKARRDIVGHKFPTDLKNQLNDAFRDKARAIRAKEEARVEPKAAKPKKKTVVPPSQPNVARQKAKENLPPDWGRRIDKIKSLTEAEGLMDELEQDKDLPDEDFNRVAEALNERMAEFEDQANAMNGAGVAFVEPIDKGVRERLDKHFASGGGIDTAPTEGLYHYLLVNPERFSVRQQTDNKGISGIDIITDTATGQRWFAKHTEFANDYGKEALAGSILNALGLSKHRVRVSSNHPYGRAEKNRKRPKEYGGGQVLLSQDALQGNGLDGELKRAADMNQNEIAKAWEEVLKGLRDGDPDGLIHMALFDYLIDNTADRHANNAFFQRQGGRLRVQFIDQGLAFGGFRPLHRDDNGVAFPEWFGNRYRANNRGGWDIAGLIGQSVNGRDDLARRVEDAAKKIGKLDLAEMRSQYEAMAGDDRAMSDQIDAMFEMLEARLAFLTDSDNHGGIVNMIVRAGGM